MCDHQEENGFYDKWSDTKTKKERLPRLRSLRNTKARERDEDFVLEGQRMKSEKYI
jgi:hypothetical protein